MRLRYSPLLLAVVGAAIGGVLASPADSPPIAAQQNQVLAAEGMAVPAVRLPCLPAGEAISAQHVFAMSDGLEVTGVHARSIPAQMVDLAASGKRANQEFVGRSVSELQPTVDADSTVALRITMAGPHPALVRRVQEWIEATVERDATDHGGNLRRDDQYRTVAWSIVGALLLAWAVALTVLHAWREVHHAYWGVGLVLASEFVYAWHPDVALALSFAGVLLLTDDAVQHVIQAIQLIRRGAWTFYSPLYRLYVRVARALLRRYPSLARRFPFLFR